MKITGRRALILGAVIALLAMALFSWSHFRDSGFSAKGPRLPNFTLMSQAGNLVELYRQKQARAVVLISFQIGCPMVRKNIPDINALAAKYAEAGVRFFYLDSSPEDTRDKLIEEAANYKIEIPILMDDTQIVAKSLEISRTTEMLLIEPKTWRTVFRGPLSDRLGYGIEKTEDAHDFFATALNEFLRGRRVNPERVETLGCAIDFDEVKADYSMVAPIIKQKCGYCHADLGLAPTNLWTYKDLKNWGKMIKEVLRTETMPPWEVDTYYSKVQKDTALTREEKQTIYAWIDGGFPEGHFKPEPAAPPKARHFEGNLILRNKGKIFIPANSRQPWYYEELLNNTPEDIWVSAVDFELSRRGAVQHIALVILDQPMDLSENVFEPQNRAREHLYNTLRWSAQRDMPVKLPEGLAFRIPKGSYVYLEVHFTGTGKDETEDVTAHLTTVKKSRALRELKDTQIIGSGFPIPRKTESYKITGRQPIAEDTYVLAAGAHMHWRGKSASISEVRPDGTRKILFSQRYIFENRGLYALAEPILVKAGSVLETTFEYDNSASNPAHIDFRQDVLQGPDAYKDEMAVMHVLNYKK